MKGLVSIAAAGLLASSAAFAQPASAPAAKPVSPAPGTTQSQPAGHTPTGNTDVRQMIRSDLEKAGFTDVTVMPNSFLVQAKDRSGDPVTMIVGPNSMTAVVAQTASGATADPSTGASTAPAASSADAGTSGSMFTTVPQTDRLSSEVVGLDVYNNANQDIGTIKDIAYTGSSVQAYILAVGGVLGVGDHYVAVSPSDLKVSYDANAKKWHANMDTTADQLKNAPAFTYSAKT